MTYAKWFEDKPGLEWEEEVSLQVCSHCGCDKPKVFVHGHYQCADCKCNTDPCCDGAAA